MRQYYVAVGTQDAKLTTLIELLQALRAGGAGAAGSGPAGGAGGDGAVGVPEGDGAAAPIALAIACGSRDSLDRVVAVLAACGAFALAVLHSDLTIPELEGQVADLKERAALQQRKRQRPQEGPGQQQAGGEAPGEPPAGPLGAAGLGVPAPDGRGEGGGPAAAPAAAVEDAAGAEAPGGGGGGGGGGGPLAGGGDGPPPPRASLVLAATDVCLRALPKEVLPVGLPLLIQYDIPPTKEVFTRRVATVFGGSKERRRAGAAAAGAGAAAPSGQQQPHHQQQHPQQPRGPAPVIIDFVVAGELPAFRARERFSTMPVQEMPVHVPDIFLP